MRNTVLFILFIFLCCHSAAVYIQNFEQQYNLCTTAFSPSFAPKGMNNLLLLFMLDTRYGLTKITYISADTSALPYTMPDVARTGMYTNYAILYGRGSGPLSFNNIPTGYVLEPASYIFNVTITPKYNIVLSRIVISRNPVPPFMTKGLFLYNSQQSAFYDVVQDTNSVFSYGRTSYNRTNSDYVRVLKWKNSLQAGWSAPPQIRNRPIIFSSALDFSTSLYITGT